MKINYKPIIIYFILSASAVLPYLNTFDVSFQLDDNHTILNNKEIGDLKQYLNFNKWKGITYNRQIARLTFTINYLIGKKEVFGYHIFNTLIHIINTILVYILIKTLFLTTILSSSQLKKNSELISFFSALIFAVHPVQIQAVTYITQRMVSLSIMFYLSAVIFYLKGRLIENKKRFIYLALVFIFFILGLYCKEIIYSLPLTLIAIEFFFFRDDKNNLNKKYFYGLLGITLAAVVLFIIFFGMPKQSEGPDRFTYLLTQLYVLLIYIKLLFLPIGQHLYYNIPLVESVIDYKAIFGFVVLLTTFYTSYKTYHKNRLVSFGIVWFYISLLIESSIFPLKYPMFEYRLYFGVACFSIVIVSLLFSLSDYINKKIIIGIFSLVILCFGFMTYNHNEVWKTPITLWENNVIESPENKEAQKNYGIELMMQGRMKDAFVSFTKSIEIDSNYSEPYAHRAVILSEHKNFESAISDANKAIILDSTKSLYFNNRGYIYQTVGEFNKAAVDIKKAIEINPKYDNALKNLSVIFYFQNKLDTALQLADSSIALDSSKGDYYNNRGNIYFALNDLERAENDFRKAVQLLPNYDKAINNVGVVLLKKNKIDDAVKYFSLAVQVNSRFTDSYYYRGYAYILKQNFVEAYNDLMMCLKLSSNHQGAINLLNKYFARK